SGIRQNSEALFQQNQQLEDDLEPLVFENTLASEQFLDFLNGSLLDVARIDVLPAAVLESGQKPLNAVFRLFDAESEAANDLTRRAVEEANRRLWIASGVTLAYLLLGGGLLVALLRHRAAALPAPREVSAVPPTVV